MRKRGRQSRPISLFGFQDIIVSVSGVVIVMVLLLMLELVERPARPAETDFGETASELRAAVAEARAKRDRLRSQLSDLDRVVDRAGTTSPLELRAETDQAAAEIDKLQQELPRLKQDAQELEQKFQQQREALTDIQADLEEARKQVAETESELKKAQDNRRTILSLPRGFDKEGWLVVAAGDRVSAAPLQRPAEPTVFRGRLLTDPAEQFVDWADERQARYFFVLVRPGGIAAFNEIRKWFESDGVDYGFDLAGSDQVFLDPKRGAVR